MEFVPRAAYQFFMPSVAYSSLCSSQPTLYSMLSVGYMELVSLATHLEFVPPEAYQLLYGPEAYHLLHGRAAYQVFEQYAYQHCMSLVAYIAHGDARGIHDHGAPRGLHDHRAILGLSASMDGRPTKVLWTSGLPCFANPCTLEEVVRLAE